MIGKIKDILNIPAAHAELTKLNDELTEKNASLMKLQTEIDEYKTSIEATTGFKLVWEQEKTDLVKLHTEELTKLKTDFEVQIAALNKKAIEEKVNVEAEVNAKTANALTAIGVQDSTIKEVVKVAPKLSYTEKVFVSAYNQ